MRLEVKDFLLMSHASRLTPDKVLSCILAFVVLYSTPAYGESNVPVGSWVYRALERLQAVGLIESGSLESRPISRKEAARLILEAERLAEERPGREGSTPYKPFGDVIARLKKEFSIEIVEMNQGIHPDYVRPLDEVRLRYVFFDNDTDVENERGFEYHEGANLLLGLSGRLEKGPLSVYALWEGRWQETAGLGDAVLAGRLEEAYLKLQTGRWFMEVGRESLWWGPGRHGALLLSDNARPFDLVRIGSDEPFLLPDPLSKLGLISIECFLTRLEENRVVSAPYLLGMRLSLRITPRFEVGALRTAMFGGDGRPVTWRTIWNVLTAQGENEPGEAGNQLASVYWKYRVPAALQPFEFYGEFGGEDHTSTVFFSRNALLLGLYFPVLGSSERFDLRLEYVDTYLGGHSDHPRIWYQHHIYQSGYTYKGRVIGHHAGTDARDFYLELGFYPKEGLRVWSSLDFEKRELSYNFPEEHTELSIGVEFSCIDRLGLEASYTYEKIDNYGFVSGAERDGDRLSLQATWKF